MKLLLDENLPKRLKVDFPDKYPIPVIVLNASDNTYLTLSSLVPKIKAILKRGLGIGVIEITDH